MFLPIEAAFCSAERVTIVGSMIPALTRSTISPVSTFRPWPFFALRTSLTTTEPSRPAFSRDLTERLLERAEDDLGAGLLVRILEQVEVERLLRVQQRDAAARDDALLEGGAGRLQRVLDAVLLLLHLGLGRSADLDDRDAARQLREPLLELLAIEVGVGVLDLGLDLLDPALDRLGGHRRRR